MHVAIWFSDVAAVCFRASTASGSHTTSVSVSSSISILIRTALRLQSNQLCYKNLLIDSKKKLASLLSSKTRFQRISEREDRSDVPSGYNKYLSKGKYLALYRGVDVIKCPVDYVLYQQLLHYARKL